MINEKSVENRKRAYEAPVVTRVHLDPVKDLLAQCLKADQSCGEEPSFLS